MQRRATSATDTLISKMNLQQEKKLSDTTAVVATLAVLPFSCVESAETGLLEGFKLQIFAKCDYKAAKNLL
jgi:hypothetical protein